MNAFSKEAPKSDLSAVESDYWLMMMVVMVPPITEARTQEGSVAAGVSLLSSKWLRMREQSVSASSAEASNRSIEPKKKNNNNKLI